MKRSTDPYTPINCNYYDKLEAWAVLRQEVVINHWMENGEKGETKGRMVDFYIKKDDKAEYVKMADGKEIRLDYLIAVNGEEVPNAC